MKRVFLLLGLILASIAFSNAQPSLQLRTTSVESQLKGATAVLPEGFTYANRDNIKKGELAPVGLDTPGIHFASAMELPAAEGVSIKGIAFITSSKKPGGKIFILSRDITSGIGNYLIEHIEEVKLKEGLNNFAFKEPLATKKDKIYAIGYECISSEEVVNPVIYVQDTVFWPEATLLTLGGKENEPALGKTGDKVTLMNFAEFKMGNLAAVALLDDPQKKMESIAIFSGLLPPYINVTGNSIPASDSKVDLQIYNLGTKPFEKVLLNVKKYDGTTDSKELTLNLKPLESKKITYELGEITKKGRGLTEFVLEKVDGKLNGCHDPKLTKFVAEYKLYEDGWAVLRNELLIEFFTEESCGACPSGKKRLDTALLALDKRGIKSAVAAHHTGLTPNGDFLTLPQSKELLPYFLYPLGTGFNPAMVLNRIGGKAVLDASEEVSLLLNLGAVENIIKMANVALAQSQEAYIEKIEQKKNADGTRNIVVKGKDLSGQMKDNIFLSIYRVESGIPHREQLGLEGEEAKTFKHNNVIRQFVTPTFGMPITEWQGSDFTVTIKDLKMNTDWDPDDMYFVLFLHRDIRTQQNGNKGVYSSVRIGLNQMEGTREVADALRPIARAEEGRIVIHGAYDSFVVYDLGGKRVAVDSQTVLPEGVYVVKTRLGEVEYASKVVVRY